MMNIPSGKRGSALLIVLGMLSFMIVSAVAFSVYMRMSRAPSSYLRRNVSSQHLVKAALARAIEDIDDKIGNDPYPGVGPNATDENCKIIYTAHDGQVFNGYGNTWNNRVFCPYANEDTQREGLPDTKFGSELVDDSGEGHKYVDFDTTAAVLTLEGLGYIPAPIVNQARYWSRKTETARWRRFNYDLGRWAYVAINVSDLLDINSIHAYTNRNSGDFGRLSLSAVVKDAGVENPRDFDDFVWKSNGRHDYGDVPFTSIMDFNLALQESGPVESPFYKWITETREVNDGFYFNSPSNKVASLLFVTDSWYPSTNSFLQPKGNEYLYLSRPEDQPFINFNNPNMFEFTKKNASGVGKSFKDIFYNQIGVPGLACLYDYLDKDSIPLSLVLPCTEQVPMIIGVCPTATLTFKVSDNVQKSDGNETKPKTITHDLQICLESAVINIDTMLLYPFKRVEPENFQIQAMVRVYLGDENMPFRIDDSNGKPTSLYPDPTTVAWKKGFENNIYTFVSSSMDITDMLPKDTDLKNGENGKAIVGAPDKPLIIQINETDKTLRGFFKWTKTKTKNPDTGLETEETEINDFTFLPYNTGGVPVSWDKKNGFEIKAVVPHVAVWVRVKKGNDTVDLVPATFKDDRLNGRNIPDGAISQWGPRVCGRGAPFFNFKTKSSGNDAFPILPTAPDALIKWAKDNVDDAEETVSKEATGVGNINDDAYDTICCYDPRYNFAPEDWYYVEKREKKGVDTKNWNDKVKELLGEDGRDSDIFMFVSNQEYLQSMGELAFLPRTRDLKLNNPGSGDPFEGCEANHYKVGESIRGFNVAFVDYDDRDAFGNQAYFWRTYRAYAHDDFAADPIYNLGICDDDGRGPRVNPYSENPEKIILTAIADTPYDYWAASTNKNVDSGAQEVDSGGKDGVGKFLKEYCFNKDSELAKVEDDEIRAIASVIGAKMRSNNNGDWLAAYNGLDWYGNGDPKCFLNDVGPTKPDQNMTKTAINEVDRKFLYSFWRNCFGNRQQLFIVFVRAEPSVLGGAQQGGRAVALVWRDPAPPVGYEDRRKSRAYEKDVEHKDNDLLPPHRTRVLFYHQFE